ncbi:hypothetical protein HS1genome_0729 [Sulfodiicoccus acidiphilus]|uniref:Uncharacterized protein n=2 Tax=Sulfodiicoccus acidiphilus TaxID=1670455 RepID=A0A348B2D8_9CREN|nr:hypothetical protein HS1genome_0729 [Sulfodiicoccus acidiphilus]GGT90163.1 hypothetical protein GCM10007116_04920 [Sulfodiicoccus acidiphilus]
MKLGKKAILAAKLASRYMGYEPSELRVEGDGSEPAGVWEYLDPWQKAVVEALVELAEQLTYEELEAYLTIHGLPSDIPIDTLRELLTSMERKGLIDKEALSKAKVLMK